MEWIYSYQVERSKGWVQQLKTICLQNTWDLILVLPTNVLIALVVVIALLILRAGVS